VERIGIDELSVKKRHCRFACPLIDHTNGRVLEILGHRDKQTVVAWLKAGRDSGLLGSLREVTLDMWGPYADAVREVFGDTVRIVVDRYHVVSNLQDCLANGRRRIQRNLPKEAGRALKGTRWLWAKDPENLTAEEREQLAALEKFTRTVRNWLDEIANYFVSRSTNARTEGFNHGIRAILWRAFGMRNFNHLRLRVLHAFG
jgi:transposase